MLCLKVFPIYVWHREEGAEDATSGAVAACAVVGVESVVLCVVVDVGHTFRRKRTSAPCIDKNHQNIGHRVWCMCL